MSSTLETWTVLIRVLNINLKSEISAAAELPRYPVEDIKKWYAIHQTKNFDLANIDDTE